MTRLFALLACLAAAFGLFYLSARTPPPQSADAPASAFSAGRALTDIAVIARTPHPVGSAANAAARDYLLGRMTALGLAPRVQRAASHETRRFMSQLFVSGANVENIIGVLPGRNRAAPALALMAHYDSVPGSPGAADDATGVADVLEIVRAIKARGVPARDVIVAITDGEEAGLLGARAFFEGDPLARRIGFVINLESRGGGGRAAMFETGEGNGGAIALFQHAAVRPSANALTAFVYKLLPNDTDFSVAKAHGLGGLNYAFIGRQFDYHSPSATAAALDQGSVQQMGEAALGPATEAALSTSLPGRSSDVVYSDVFGLAVVAYPAWGGWIILALAAGLIAIGARHAVRDGEDSWRDIAQGAGAALLLLSGGALLLALTRHITGVGGGWLAYRPLLARFAPFEAAMACSGLAGLLITGAAVQRGQTRLAVGVGGLIVAGAAWALGNLDVTCLVLGVTTALLAAAVLGRPARAPGTWQGLVATVFIAALALQIIAPTAAFLVAWPLLAACTCAALTGWGTRRNAATATAVFVLSAIMLGWLGGFFHTLLQGLDVPEGPSLVVWLAAALLWPMTQLAPKERDWGWAPALLTLGVGLAIALWLQFTSPWTARHPAAAEPLYVVDEGGKAWRAAPMPAGVWTRAVLTADGGAYGEREFPAVWVPGAGTRFAAASAHTVAATPRDITLTRGPDGVVTLHAAAPAGGDAISLKLRVDTPVSDVTVAGRPTPILDRPGEWTHLLWQGAPDGVTIRFRPRRSGALELDYALTVPRWPADTRPLPAMPPDVMAWDRAGATMLIGSRRLAW